MRGEAYFRLWLAVFGVFCGSERIDIFMLEEKMRA